MPPKKSAPRKKVMKKRVPGRKYPRRRNPNIVRLTQTISSNSQTGAPNPPTFNKIYKMESFALTNCDRAVQVARAYQFYRLKYIEIRFKAKQDTYIGSAAGVWQGSIPYLYWLYDPVGTMSESQLTGALNFNVLRDAGIKPLRFDDKNIVVRFKPAVVQATQDSEGTTNLNLFSKAVKSPWLSTNSNSTITGIWNPSSVDHRGLVFGVEQENPPNQGSNQLQLYDWDITYHFEFKRARGFSTTGVGLEVVKVNLDRAPDFVDA